MSKAHRHGLAAHASNPWPHSSDDPTATKTLRSRWAAEFYRRFRTLKGALRTGVIDRNAFGIDTSQSPEERAGPGTAQPEGINQPRPGAPPGPTTPPQSAGININPPRPGEFDFPSDAKKVSAFEDWLDQQANRGILEVGRAERDVSAGTPWQNTYIRQGYSKGVTHADAALVEQGVMAPQETLEAVFQAPQHADGVGMIFTRSYSELQGVTDAMGQQMSRELADGLAAGENPREIARRLNDRIDKVGLHRGRLIARTETIRAHNEGALNRYEDVSGRLEGVSVLAEHITAGDLRVCPVCASLAGSTYTIREARGRIPVHPNCRCTWIPVEKGEDAPVAERSPVHDALDDVPEEWSDDGRISAFEDAIAENTPLGASLRSLDADQAELVARIMADLDSDGLLDEGFDEAGPWSAVRVEGGSSPGSAGGHMAIDEANHTRRVVVDEDVFGQDSADWADAAEEGFIAADPDNVDRHILLHELGHAKHHTAIQNSDNVFDTWRSIGNYGFDADEEALIKEEVSDYAAANPTELVAETWAARVQGEEFSDDLLRMVQSFTAPDLENSPTLLGNRLKGDPVSNDRARNPDLPEFLADEVAATFEAFETSFGDE